MAWRVAAGGWRSESKQRLVEEQLEHCSDEHERLVLEEKLAAQMEAAEEVCERVVIVVHAGMHACMHVVMHACMHMAHRQMVLYLMPPPPPPPPPAPPGQTTS
eukprot:COSAG01_NODE_1909_length_8928_cov_64.180315_5_plen_103_part_00